MVKSRYFNGLDGIRFYAALCVIVAHVRAFAPDGFTFPFGGVFDLFVLNAYDAVSLFFVLSGFLITYRLLEERQQTGRISVKKFYLRRTLRIWPLYYAVILLTLVIVPVVAGHSITPVDSPLKLGAVLTFNAEYIHAYSSLGVLGHLWSIGVEELFYLCWPLLVRRYPLIGIIVAIIVYRLVMVAVFASTNYISAGTSYLEGIKTLLSFFRFECMAIGALGAWLVFRRHWTLRVIYRLDTLALAVIALIIVWPDMSSALYDLTISLVFMVFIINVATNPQARLKLNRPILKRLGQASYGIYMLHPLVIYFTSRLMMRWGMTSDLMLTAVCIGLTVIAALLSYRYFETPFLRLKARFDPVSHTSMQTLVSPAGAD